MRVPWTLRKSHQFILKEIIPEYSLKGLMLKLYYFGHLMQTANSMEKSWCWERLRAWEEGGNRGWDGWILGQTLGDSGGQGGMACCHHGVAKSWTQLSNWTTKTVESCKIFRYSKFLILLWKTDQISDFSSIFIKTYSSLKATHITAL